MTSGFVLLIDRVRQGRTNGKYATNSLVYSEKIQSKNVEKTSYDVFQFPRMK